MTTKPITLEQQIECVRREISMRRKSLPTWVSSGSMSRERANHEVAAMEAALETIKTARWVAELGAGELLEEAPHRCPTDMPPCPECQDKDDEEFADG